MRVFKVLTLLLLGFSSEAQQLLPQSYDTLIHGHQVHVSGLGFFQTSHLRNEMSNIFLRGGYLSDEIKQNSRLAENQNGRIGGELSGEVVFKSGTPLSKSNENHGWIAKIGYSNVFGSQYSKDAFDLIFFGNQSMLGEEATIANTSAFNLSFYKAGFGIYNRRNKNSILLNALFGGSYTGIDIDRGNLTFSDDGGVVEANLNMGIQQSISPAYFQGLGAAIDFELHAAIKDIPGISGVFQLSGRNLGVMYLSKVESYGVNSELTYSGFTLNELSDFANYSSSDFDAYIDSLGLSASQFSGVRWVPGGTIQAGKIVEEGSEKVVQSFFGVRVLTNITYRPMAFAGAHVALNDWLALGGQLTFGGYGGFRGGMYAQAEFNNIQLGIGSEDIVGFFSQSTFGKSLLIRGVWRLD